MDKQDSRSDMRKENEVEMIMIRIHKLVRPINAIATYGLQEGGYIRYTDPNAGMGRKNHNS